MRCNECRSRDRRRAPDDLEQGGLEHPYHTRLDGWRGIKLGDRGDPTGLAVRVARYVLRLGLALL